MSLTIFLKMLQQCQVLYFVSVLLMGFTEAAFLPDYEYIGGVGWLRLHIVPATWPDAQLRCHLEDATLTAPTTSAITAAMKKTMVAHRLGESSVFTDMYASNPKGEFLTINGLPLSSITLQWAVGEPNNLDNAEDCLVMTGVGELADVSCSSVHPFFCLKRNTTYIYNQCDTSFRSNQGNITTETNQCDTTVEGYTWEPRTGSCYKFHREALIWSRAAMVCTKESGTLAVINSDVESEVLKEHFEINPPETHTGTETVPLVHIGILDWNQNRNWLTVFGDTLAEAGFQNWDDNEPNNMYDSEFCGSMTFNGLLNDSPCYTQPKAFICEITPKHQLI